MCPFPVVSYVDDFEQLTVPTSNTVLRRPERCTSAKWAEMSSSCAGERRSVCAAWSVSRLV